MVQNLFSPNSTGPWLWLQKGRKTPELKHNFGALPSDFKALESNSRHFNLIGSLVSGAAWDDLLSSVFAGSPSLLSPLLSGSPFFVSIFSSLFSLFLDSFLDSDLLLESMKYEACCNYNSSANTPWYRYSHHRLTIKIKKTFDSKIVNIFLSISFNICFGCSKEPSQWDGSLEYQQHMLWLRNMKFDHDFVCLIWIFTSLQQSFSYKGVGLLGLNQY